MNTDGKEKKTQNRELVGESVEIIGDQALCQCVNGSVQVPLKVTSQQKFYCNSASRLIATNGDNDGRSLNFGSCKARNNSPCMPMIQWKHFYDKILFGNTLSPLTMKSQGMCTFGGTVSFVTSGQQVMVKPPCSVGEARRIVHTNPLFKEEDMKGKASVKPQRNDAPVERRVSKAFVTSVRVNGKAYVSPRAHDNGPLVFTNTLTSGASDSVAVKWDVTCNGRDVATGLSAPPPREFFGKEGEYKVFAYVKDRGSKEGGGYVTVEVSCPTFMSLGWENANGEAVHLVGKRYAAYANLKFKGMGDIPVKARFYFLGGNGKQYLTDYTPLAIGQDGRARVKLVLTDSQVKQIMDEERSWDMKALIRVELASGEWVDGLKRSEDSEIEYTDKKDIVSTMLYRDKDCNEEVTGFVECGQTVYARIITRGFEDSLLTLSVFRHGTVPDDNSAATGYVFKAMGDVGNDGVCIQEMVTEQSWLQGKHSETFDMLVIGGCFMEEMNNTPSDRENYSTRNACKTFQMGKDKGILLLCLPKQEIEDGQSKTMVQNVNGDGDGCPRCREEWADLLARLQQIFKVERTKLETVARIYTKYMLKLGMDTCWIKAHFFAQVYVETGGKLDIKDGEGFNYYWEALIGTFAAFKSKEGKEKAKLWGRSVKNRTEKGYKAVSRNTQMKIANYAYSPHCPKGQELGNIKDDDGWTFRGRGVIQITGRKAYADIENILNKIGYKCDLTSDEAHINQVATNLEIGIVASMAFFKWKNVNMYQKCNGELNSIVISKIVGKKVRIKNQVGEESTNYQEKQNVFTNKTFSAFMANECQWERNATENTTNEVRWHDPVDNPQITIWTQNGNKRPANATFGARNGRHQGVDLFALENTKVYACLDGVVCRIVKNAIEGQGQTIVVKISDKQQLELFRKRRVAYKPYYPGEKEQGEGFEPNADTIYMVYYHLNKIYVNVNQQVKCGDVLGLSGISGIAGGTCGPHLHFEIRSKARGSKLRYRCNPAYYVYYKQEDKIESEDKLIQEKRKQRGKLKDFKGK